MIDILAKLSTLMSYSETRPFVSEVVGVATAEANTDQETEEWTSWKRHLKDESVRMRGKEAKNRVLERRHEKGG